ncbi:MAG TPA: hypothetical protein VH141_27685 [Pseudonocardia sp.]|nr:hypothetical protein [Pseudonocardia sp.]
MLAFLLPVVALVLVAGAIGRYRSDARARFAGVTAAVAATLAVSLAVPGISTGMALSQVVTSGAVAIVVAVLGTVYAERRLRLVRN